MDSGSRSKLLVALGRKNEELRMKMSGGLTHSLKRINSRTEDQVDPDYIPSDEPTSSQSDRESFDEKFESVVCEQELGSEKNKKRKRADSDDEIASVVSNLMDEMVNSVVAGSLVKPKKPSIGNEIASTVSDVVREIVESVSDGKEYEFGISDVNSIEFTKKGKPRKRRAYEEPPALRKRSKLESTAKLHSVKPPCKSTCHLRCPTIISLERQDAINSGFWGLSQDQMKAFVMKSQRKTPKGRITTKSNSSRREHTYQYLLTDGEGNDVLVCKVFYLATLGYDPSNDRILKSVRTSLNNGLVMPPEDRRGRHPQNTKVNREPIVTHIMSFKPTISHYRRVHAPNRLYLPNDVNIRMMHTMFKETHPELANKVSYELYRQEVAKLNISFTKLGHEECFDCEVFRLHCTSSDGHSKDQLAEDCESCMQWKTHRERYRKTRAEYHEDVARSCSSPDELIVSVDLQKVVMLPRADMFKEVIFCPRIIAFNESFVPVGSKSKILPLAVIWHEAISGRKKSDIASTFLAFFLKNRDSRSITMWLDNCAAQNKNWALFSFFIYVVNSCSEVSVERLEIKFFEVGHTFMSADAFHHQVELSMSQRRKILDFNDFSSAVQAANNRRTNVHEMGLNDFLHDLKDYKSAAKLKKLQPKPLLPNFASVLFEKGKNYLQFKNDHSDNYQQLNYLTAAVFKDGVPAPSRKPAVRGVDQARKENLISKLRPLLPPSRHAFWEALDVTNSGEPLDDE